MPTFSIKVNFRLPDTLYQRALDTSKITGRSLSRILRDGLSRELDRIDHIAQAAKIFKVPVNWKEEE